MHPEKNQFHVHYTFGWSAEIKILERVKCAIVVILQTIQTKYSLKT